MEVTPMSFIVFFNQEESKVLRSIWDSADVELEIKDEELKKLVRKRIVMYREGDTKSELIEGIKKTDENIEILYESDPYGALKYFANRMNIDFDRFKSVQLQLNTIYDYAFIASKPPYMWDKKIYKFFSYFKKNVPSSKSIYISSSNSKNNIIKLVNDNELEKELKLNNIEIIHSENLSLDEQINTFSSAKTIIGPHGAGITNILFCNDKPRIIELFSDKLIKCDFFMRSQHINAQYTPHICFDNIINIDFVMKSIFEEE